MSRRSATIRLGCWLLGAVVLLYAVLGIALAELSLRLHRRSLAQAPAYRATLQRELGTTFEDVSITAVGGAIMKGWLLSPPQPNGRSVIVLHGVTDNRLGAAGFAPIFLRKGYTVLVPDSRAHGESGGEIATYGVLEREDVHRWATWLRARIPGCSYLLGESMGAAIGLQAEPVTPELCAVAVESPYSTFRPITYERLGRGSHTGPLYWKTIGRPIIEAAVAYTWLRYGVYLPDANPEAAVLRSTTPTLLIAGTADQNIPMHHAQELERLCASHCSLWIVPGADHGEASAVAHAEFEHRVLGWFADHAGAP